MFDNMPRPSPKFLCLFFVFANFFNYLDRGIIPGAASEFDGFIEESSEGIPKDHVDTYFGVLQSSFIVGLSISMPIFANLVHTQPPFLLVGIGLAVWCASAVVAGLAQQTNSYTVLVLARMLSGVGEASFQVVAAPYIQDHAGDAKGLWLGYYYTAIPFGTCIGYGYGAILAGSPLGWSFAFYLEALMMAPLSLLCFALPRDIHSNPHGHKLTHSGSPLSLEAAATAAEGGAAAGSVTLQDIREHGGGVGEEREKTAKEEGVKMMDEVVVCFERPLFVLSMLGYAAYSGGIIGFSTFGPQFVMGLGYFDEEYEASLVFGAAMASAGLVGTPLGGWLLDWTLERRRLKAGPASSNSSSSSGSVAGGSEKFGVGDTASPLTAGLTAGLLGEESNGEDNGNERDEDDGGDERGGGGVSDGDGDGAGSGGGDISEESLLSYVNSTFLSFQCNTLGAAFVVLCVLAKDKALFFGMFALAGVCLFVSTAAMNLSVLESVPPQHRSFAIAFSTLLMHAFGDVPSPIVVGTLKGSLAPDCTPSGVDDDKADDAEVAIPDGCDGEQTQLRLVVGFIALWIALSPLCYLACTILARRRITRWPCHAKNGARS